MALININTNNARHVRVMNAMCSMHGYEAVDEEGVPNPETPALFAERMLKDFVLQLVKAQEQKAANREFIKNNPIADLIID